MSTELHALDHPHLRTDLRLPQATPAAPPTASRAGADSKQSACGRRGGASLGLSPADFIIAHNIILR